MASVPSAVPMQHLAHENCAACGGVPLEERPVARVLSKREIGAHIRAKFGRVVVK